MTTICDVFLQERSVRKLNKKQNSDKDDLLPNYDLDYSKAKPNHFANLIKNATTISKQHKEEVPPQNHVSELPQVGLQE